MNAPAKTRVHQAFPQCVAIAESFRAAFGPGVRMIYASENGQQAGRKPDESRALVIAGDDLVITRRNPAS